MTWLVRIAAGVTIAVLILVMVRTGTNVKAYVLVIAAILVFVGTREGLDMSGFWGKDDDDDQQGPLRPA